MTTRDRTFTTLDFWETGDVIWALDRECDRIRLTMKNMDEDARNSTQPLLDRMQQIRDRLQSRYGPAKAEILSRAGEVRGEVADAR